MTRVREEEIVCAEVLLTKGRSIRGIAGELRMDESTLRYHLKRRRAKAVDGRRGESEACADFDAVIRGWVADQSAAIGRPASIRLLYETCGGARLHRDLQSRFALCPPSDAGAADPDARLAEATRRYGVGIGGAEVSDFSRTVRSSYHSAFRIPAAAASPRPRIQEKYHIDTSPICF
jgi:hypothetical protein